MSLPETPLIRPPATGRTIGVGGDVYRFLATGAENGGRYAMWEAIVPPGSGPPPHIHSREAEAFCVLEGEMTFYLEDERITAPQGSFVHAPPGSLHRFCNESGETARMTITIVPAGLEEMFFEVGHPLSADAVAAPAPTPADIENLIAAAPRYGVELRLPH
ncbi:cupin domain-containing protein [Planctomicrobium piriforme]|uniref:Cupin domain protein n=1 Tax=Planctomicrobium piriforme TaxID=1576369 RepID=A0A1I3PWY6_9PLAN|nr:cupin domain-containing protein [Planctomicrobium piriforme]SFJ25979.1 Cupin domain protein [Planctomicrobium piriforme]